MLSLKLWKLGCNRPSSHQWFCHLKNCCPPQHVRNALEVTLLQSFLGTHPAHSCGAICMSYTTHGSHKICGDLHVILLKVILPLAHQMDHQFKERSRIKPQLGKSPNASHQPLQPKGGSVCLHQLCQGLHQWGLIIDQLGR